MGITKWDLFKQIDKIPVENYHKIKEYLDKLTELQVDEVFLDEEGRRNLEKAFDEYEKGEYLTFDEVFEDGENNV